MSHPSTLQRVAIEHTTTSPAVTGLFVVCALRVRTDFRFAFFCSR